MHARQLLLAPALVCAACATSSEPVGHDHAPAAQGDVVSLGPAVPDTAGDVVFALEPLGPHALVEERFGKLDFLGVTELRVATLNRIEDPDTSILELVFSEVLEVPVPLGTREVVASLQSCSLFYGSLEPDTLEAHLRIGPGSSRWKQVDHHVANVEVSFHVFAVDDVDDSTTPPTQTAACRVNVNLLDHNRDDPWFGIMHWNLQCFGEVPLPQVPSRGGGEVLDD